MADNITEGAPRPNPEASYNPRIFISMATNPDFFDREMPSIIKEVATMSDARVKEPLLPDMRRTMNEFRNHVPLIFLDVIYNDFARKKGWLVKEHGVPQDMQLTQPMETLSDEQQEEWGQYRLTGEVPRDVAVDAFIEGVIGGFERLPAFALVTTGQGRDPVAKNLDRQLRQAPFLLARKFFPDM